MPNCDAPASRNSHYPCHLVSSRRSVSLVRSRCPCPCCLPCPLHLDRQTPSFPRGVNAIFDDLGAVVSPLAAMPVTWLRVKDRVLRSASLSACGCRARLGILWIVGLPPASILIPLSSPVLFVCMSATVCSRTQTTCSFLNR